MRPQTNTLIDGRYRVIDLLGTGGMADVYLAEDQNLGRKVAVKLLHERFARDQEFVQRFHREASAAAGLQHKNVVNVFDRGQFDGTYYIAMEFLAGRTLKELIRAEAPMAPQRAVAICAQILAAARVAHRSGIVHRDLKPQNIIVDEEGTVKVTDFGIAGVGKSDVTESGAVMGTAQYISPEQAHGKEVGPASDLYSIGVVLYEMLTGKVPFEGDTAVALALQHVSAPPPRPSAAVPGLSPAFDAVIAKAMAKQPAERFASADEFTAALGAALGQATGLPTAATEATAVTRIVPAIAGAATSPPPGQPAQGATVATVGPPVPPTDPTPEDQSRQRKDRIWWWVGFGLVVAIAALAYFLLASNGRVTVPYVEGRSLEDAQAQLARYGLRSRVFRRKDNAPVNEVVAQDPQRGAEVKKDSVVTLTVSSGPGTVKVPPLAGLPEKRAVERLRVEGLLVRIEREFSTEFDEGIAIKTVPDAGAEVDRRTTVDLFISKGPEQVGVPDVVGLTREAATARLKDAGFKVEVNAVSSPKPKDTVLTQSPKGGGKADEGSTVTLEVSNAEVPVPNTVDLPEEDALAELKGAGFRVRTVDSPTNDASRDGLVLSQQPAGGSLESGGLVTITVERFDAAAP